MERNNIIKGQYGIPIIAPSTSWKEWKRRLDKGSEKILKVLEPVGKAFVKGIAGLGSNYGTSSVPYVPRTVEELKREEKSLKIRELQVEKAMPYLSPSNYVVAWTLGSFNPKVGQLKIAEWGPSALLASLGVDAIGFKYVPKGVKVTTKNGKAYIISKTINTAVKNNRPKATRVRPKLIFKARVYKGGDITDPHSNFVTTDRRYASLYGPVTSYEFESSNPTFTKEPMMGYRDPVSLDMFVYRNTKNNPSADAIIGHDLVAGEFPYTSLGIEILNLNPKNLIKKVGQRRVISEGTYPWYRGKQHSVKEVVNPDGTINPKQAMRILHEISELFPGSYKMEHRLENKEYHPTDPTTYNHTKNVAKSAWGLDVPYGLTKHDLMVAAVGHDFGKMVSGDGHAQIGADLAKQVFPDLTDAQYTAIAEHMGSPKTPLGKATKMADMRNGIVVRNINGKTRILLPTHTDAKPREFVMDPQGNNKYYIHMRVWDDVDKHIPGNISNVEKNNLFQTLYETLPDNAEILFPKSGPENYGTRGTVAGLLRLSRDPRFQPGTPGTLYYKGKNNEVQTYQGTSFIKKPLFGFEGYPYAYEGAISMSDVQGFINNDIIPRLRELGHQIESYTPNVRSADFKNDLFDLKMRRENGGAWFSPSTNDITLRGPLENLSFDLVLHETGGHGIRYNMLPDYRPVSREVVNDYLTNIYDPVKQLPLLKAHIGKEVFNDFEATTLGDAYPEVAGYFEGYINGLSGKKLPPEMVTLRILDELGAVNTQFRAKLSENGRLTGKALNKKVQETPEGVILRMEIEQGYTSMGILERISKITGVSMDELNFYNPASLQKLVEKFPELKTIADKVKYAMTHVAVGAGVMYGLNQYGMVELKKKGGKTHKPSQRSRPWGHRSILDNGWQSTKLLKNKKNVYGK